MYADRTHPERRREEERWHAAILRVYKDREGVSGFLSVKSKYWGPRLARGSIVAVEILLPNGRIVEVESRVRRSNEKTGLAVVSVPAHLARLIARGREFPVAVEVLVRVVEVFPSVSDYRPFGR